MNAIIYTTNAGSTERYAKLLAHETGLPAYSLAEAAKTVPANAEIIYLGWIMAGSVKGYAAAAKRCKVRAVCGVGMGRTGTQTESVKKLHGVYRLMMGIMVKTAGKDLAAKKNHTPEEDDMLDMMLRNGERVSADNLRDLLDWYRAQR